VGIINPEREAEIFLSFILKINRSEIYLNFNKALKNTERKRLEEMVQKRIKHIPSQYITKSQEFMGMDFLVEEDVLIPRPETEILVEKVIKKLKNKECSSHIQVVDLGTGTGIIAICLAKFIKNITVYATDISKKSLQIALKNTQKHKCKNKIIFLPGDIFKAIRGKIKENSLEGIISNPPYITADELKSLPPEIKDNEPEIALNGGVDGLKYYRKIIRESPYYLKKDGFIALEIGFNQYQKIKEMILKNKSYKQNVEIIKDYSGIERVVIAYRK
jgi:release factor glutamine methyltransferase